MDAKGARVSKQVKDAFIFCERVNGVTGFALVEEESGFLAVENICGEVEAVFLEWGVACPEWLAVFTRSARKDMIGDGTVFQSFYTSYVEVGAFNDGDGMKGFGDSGNDFVSQTIHTSGM